MKCARMPRAPLPTAEPFLAELLIKVMQTHKFQQGFARSKTLSARSCTGVTHTISEVATLDLEAFQWKRSSCAAVSRTLAPIYAYRGLLRLLLGGCVVRGCGWATAARVRN
ncbi:hypothetical protein BC830DRAFT_171870 [Chytriomyces sp. MP71]|nr:hypothetical protein BC830DRAFT_171870 [Chytriomyces sp. MP71]